MSDVETTVQLEEALASRKKIPAELSFEEVIKNNTLPPCSLNDFMDYLFCVENNAEGLQFFLWYCDYVQRWSTLLPRQKALSPIWGPEKPSASRFIRYSHKRDTSEKMNKIISIMEMDQSRRISEYRTGDIGTRNSTSTNYSRPRTSSSASSVLSPIDAKEDWQPFTIQPFRDEVTRIVKHYIAESAPRQLNLTQQDRDACLHAVSHTTHPSALLPAFIVTEANLKRCSHPAFIRWSISNATKARLVALRLLGLLLITLGLTLDIVLILSRLSPFLRILCVLLWWPGATVLVAASRWGLCLFLHLRHTRQLRPWELATDDDDDTGTAEENNTPPAAAAHRPSHAHARKDTALSTTSSASASASASSSRGGADPLRKPSLQTFGPRNEPPGAQARPGPLRARVFAGAVVAVRNRGLLAMQDRAAVRAGAWAGLAAGTLAVASVLVPSGGLFL